MDQPRPGAPVMNIRILGTGSVLEGRPVTTAELVREVMPGRDPDRLERKIGIATRRWVDRSTPAAQLGAAALRQALEAAGCPASELRRIIFVSSTGGDALGPATVHAVTEALGLDDTCDGFDLNNACTGFLSAFDLAARSVVTGLSPVAVVVAETFSRYLQPENPRPYMVFGDAAAAVVIGPGRQGEGVLASHLRSSAALRGKISMIHPGWVDEPHLIRFDATPDEMTASAFQALSSSSRVVAAAAGVPLGEVEWFLPHQPNGRMLEDILARMEIRPERTLSLVEELGSVGAASIPVSLDRLYRSGRVGAGDRLLMTSVGAGTGYGAILHRVGG